MKKSKDPKTPGPSGIRLTSGLLRGMTVQAPAGLATRPTGSRVRSAVLNMLQSDLEGAQILDLFAGSGAVGLEAISRGAAGATFVEAAPLAVKTLKKNVEEASRRILAQSAGTDTLPASFEVFSGNVQDFFSQTLSPRRGAPAAPSFDIVWADPPWKEVQNLFAGLLTAIGKILRPSGVFVLESSVDFIPADSLRNPSTDFVNEWKIVKDRVYGQTRICILERHEP